ncbi:MAG: MFS transporter [Vicinamibacterales bacterium]
MTIASNGRASLFGWWHHADRPARRALIAASLGWMLDAFDVQLYAMVLVALMSDLDMNMTTAGWLGSMMLIASAVGGFANGFVADRYGRRTALTLSILVYSVFTAACGFAQTVTQLAFFRVLLGLGMGGEWTSGAALVSETWTGEHRGKALGMMQSSWAVGYALAALVTAIVMPFWGWRAVFFVGVLPAFFVIWVQRRVEEPAIWREHRLAAASKPRSTFFDVFRGRLLALTVAVTLMNAFTMFAWWGFNQWLPAYLRLPASRGGIGLSTYAMSGLVLAMQVGMWFGYVTFGFIADSLGRKRTYVTFLLSAAILMLAYAGTRNPLGLLLLGPFVAFFSTGYFSGFGAVTAEIYPTAIRATSQGFTYNIGRVASAIAPVAVGSLAEERGFGVALSMTAVAFFAAAAAWIWIPETRGRRLQ